MAEGTGSFLPSVSRPDDMRCQSLVPGFVALLAASCSSATASDSLNGIRGIVERRMPKHVDAFTFKMTRGSDDAFTISDSHASGGITVSCTTVSACARGLYTYVFSDRLNTRDTSHA